MEHKLVHNIRGNVECEWSAVNACGQSGGILTIWRKNVISLISSFRGGG